MLWLGIGIVIYATGQIGGSTEPFSNEVDCRTKIARLTANSEADPKVRAYKYDCFDVHSDFTIKQREDPEPPRPVPLNGIST